MLASSVRRPLMRAPRVPSRARALNSAQQAVAAALHCTDVCCGLNFTTCTVAPQPAHWTGCGVACRSSRTRRPLGGEVPRDLLLPARHRAGGVDLELEPFHHG